MKIRDKIIGCLLLFVIFSGQGFAAQNELDLSAFPNIQKDFDSLIEELGTVISYNPIAPAETSGTLGFDIGLAFSVFEITEDVWKNALGDLDAPKFLPIPRLMARKGLPFGIDLGVSYVKVPSSNITVLGGEIKKSFLSGSTLIPAISVMAHASQLSGVDDLDLSTYGLDVGISKGFIMFTPYAGVGQVWVQGSENITTLNLADFEESETRGYLGVKWSLMPVFNMVFQADSASINSYSVRFNLGF